MIIYVCLVFVSSCNLVAGSFDIYCLIVHDQNALRLKQVEGKSTAKWIGVVKYEITKKLSVLRD